MLGFDSVVTTTNDINSLEKWKECYTVLKHGGHVAVFTKISDLISIVLRLAGFEFRDTIQYVAKNPETILLFRKPLDGNVAENVLKYGVGGINIDGCRVKIDDKDDYGRSATKTDGIVVHKLHEGGWKPTDGEYASKLGRFPANIIHDGSEEIIKQFPETISKYGKSQENNINPDRCSNFKICMDGKGIADRTNMFTGDSGSASRFFQCCPTRESLISYITKLITPENGVVYDPYKEIK